MTAFIVLLRCRANARNPLRAQVRAFLTLSGSHRGVGGRGRRGHPRPEPLRRRQGGGGARPNTYDAPLFNGQGASRMGAAQPPQQAARMGDTVGAKLCTLANDLPRQMDIALTSTERRGVVRTARASRLKGRHRRQTLPTGASPCRTKLRARRSVRLRLRRVTSFSRTRPMSHR